MSKIEDLKNRRFGKLVAIEYCGRNKSNRVLWKCECDCGNSKAILAKTLKNGHSKSCGCMQGSGTRKKSNLTGKSFGRLKVIERVDKPEHLKKKEIYWKCICECGNEHIVTTTNLKNGNTRSCGCLRFERLNGIHYSERDIELDIFRPILTSCRTRSKGNKNHRVIEFNLDLNDLKKQWQKQKGICIYTDMKLLLPSWGDTKRGGDIHLASVDRIDSTKGYTKDNIQFVCLMANYAKNCFTHEDMLYFCEQIGSKYEK